MNTTEPLPALLEAYFADLDRALIGTDPRERAETIQAMREDAAETLSRFGDSDQTAERVIAEFGPVEQIAAAATPAAPAAAAAPAASRPWADIWLFVASVVGLLYFYFPVPAIAVLIWAAVRMRKHGGNRTLQKCALWISVAALAVFILLFSQHSIPFP